MNSLVTEKGLITFVTLREVKLL